jgi:hypothetical protein
MPSEYSHRACAPASDSSSDERRAVSTAPAVHSRWSVAETAASSRPPGAWVPAPRPFEQTAHSPPGFWAVAVGHAEHGSPGRRRLGEAAEARASSWSCRRRWVPEAVTVPGVAAEETSSNDAAPVVAFLVRAPESSWPQDGGAGPRQPRPGSIARVDFGRGGAPRALRTCRDHDGAGQRTTLPCPAGSASAAGRVCAAACSGNGARRATGSSTLALYAVAAGLSAPRPRCHLGTTTADSRSPSDFAARRGRARGAVGSALAHRSRVGGPITGVASARRPGLARRAGAVATLQRAHPRVAPGDLCDVG